MHVFIGHLEGVARHLAALPMAVLPARYWQRFPALPVEQRALGSALLTILAGVFLGISGFFAYAERSAVIAAAQTMEVAQQQVQGHLPADTALNIAPFAVTALAPFAFAFFTPLGLVATYLTSSGLARIASCVTLAPFGDPVLTGLDLLVRRTHARTRAGGMRRRRARDEGPEVPDRLYEGAWADRPDVDFVVVASRRKPGWEPGTFLITPEQWYTLGVPFDLRLPEGLRTVYPLKAQSSNEVLRRGLRYELPPLRRPRRP